MTSGTVLTGSYFDSVALMAAAVQLRKLPGVQDVALVMATATNKAILHSAGMLLPSFAGAKDEDLLVAVIADNGDAAAAALGAVDDALRGGGPSLPPDAPRTLHGGVAALPSASLALISVAGRFAADEALDALRLGLHVMIFSDNVPLEREVELKHLARNRGLLLMGPDCGSAIINGAPLGFANVVRRGSVGIVAASGTGLQEVSTIVSNQGAGISQALGTGGRDTLREVGGIMFLEALRLLTDDAATAVIVLIAKAPDTEVVPLISRAARRSDKPVVTAFLGVSHDGPGPWAFSATTLEEAGIAAATLAKGDDVSAIPQILAARRSEMKAIAASIRPSLAPSQRFVRGLFSGGTLRGEAASIMMPLVGSFAGDLRRSASAERASAPRGGMHSLVDLGADEFTVGRPHPMIDYSLRCRRLVQEARDPGVAVILMDVVLGYGAHPDPAGELAPAIQDAQRIASEGGRTLPIVVSVTGTAADPQRLPSVQDALREAGAVVAPSNAAASYLAATIAAGRDA
ncbi:acyl-CoA synthetase FdrA [Candidatus Fermentibacteria bacterium]|nr:acyl-CoA synthetase FdrA [Candidatus Fermentibacteria bacterium]